MALFSKAMTLALAELVDEKAAELHPPKGTPNSNQISISAWNEMTNQINARFGSNVTVAQVRTKVKDMRRERPKEQESLRRHTGGGAPVKPDEFKEQVQKYIDRAFGPSKHVVPGGVTSSLFGSSSSSSLQEGQGQVKRKRSDEAAEMEKEDEADKELMQILEKPKAQRKAKLGMEELQRSVLETELANAQKWGAILDRTTPILDKFDNLLTQWSRSPSLASSGPSSHSSSRPSPSAQFLPQSSANLPEGSFGGFPSDEFAYDPNTGKLLRKI